MVVVRMLEIVNAAKGADRKQQPVAD